MSSKIRIFFIMLLLTNMTEPLAASDSDIFSLSFNNKSNIIFSEPTERDLANPYFYIAASLYADGLALTLNTEWPIRRIDADTYAIRHINWSDFYWIIKKSTRQVYQIDRPFGEAGTGQPVPDTAVRLDGIHKTISIWFQRARLELDGRRNLTRFLINDFIILDSQEWQIENIKNGLIHVRRPFWTRPNIDFYWEVDLTSNQAYFVKGEKFDEPAKNRRLLPQ